MGAVPVLATKGAPTWVPLTFRVHSPGAPDRPAQLHSRPAVERRVPAAGICTCMPLTSERIQSLRLAATYTLGNCSVAGSAEPNQAPCWLGTDWTLTAVLMQSEP